MQEGYELSVKELKKDVFYETFGKGTRLELMNSGFGIGKLVIGLQKFDVNTKKQISYVRCYIDTEKALCFAHDILSGRIASEAKNVEKETKSGEWLKPIRTYQGGKSAEKANRPDGKPSYREISLAKGERWVFKGQEGPGKLSSMGGFVPDGKSEKIVSVGVSDEDLKSIALMIQSEYQAYRTAQYYYTLQQIEKGQKK